MPAEERRQHSRLQIRIPVGIYNKKKPHEAIDAEIRNISERGAFIYCDTVAEVGDQVMVEIRLGEVRQISGVVKSLEVEENHHLPPGIPASAVIRWADKNKGFGVEFTDLSAETRRYLGEILDKVGQKNPLWR